MPCAAAGAERSPGTRQGLRQAPAPQPESGCGSRSQGIVRAQAVGPGAPHPTHIPPASRTSQPLSPRPRSQGGGPAAFLSSSLVVARPDIIHNDSVRPLFPGRRRCRGLHRGAPPGNTPGIPELERGTCRPRGWVQPDGGGNRSHGPGIALVLPPPHQGQTVPGETKAGSSDRGGLGSPWCSSLVLALPGA